MATTAQKQAFIKLVAPLAQKAYKQFGKPLPSICIAMAAVESAWGTAGSCKYNSYMGQKVGTGKTATTYWSGDYFNSKTQEVVNQSTGQLVTIKDSFRAYDSVEQCIFNYFELLNTSLYSRVLAGSSYTEQMQQIKTCGYMTSVTEVNICLSIISQNGLTNYDLQAGSVDNSISVASKYVIGRNYTLQNNMYIRKSAGGSKKKYLQLTVNAKSNGYEDVEGYGILKKGTVVTCKGIETKNGATWMQIPSGYVCAVAADGTVYIK